MAGYRLTHSARTDIVSILAWSEEQFGVAARQRYEALIAAAIRDAASRSGAAGPTPRPELGDGVFSWHLARSRARVAGRKVHRPRHLLVCRQVDGTLVIGRVLHDAMDLRRHANPEQSWDRDDRPG